MEVMEVIRREPIKEDKGNGKEPKEEKENRIEPQEEEEKRIEQEEQEETRGNMEEVEARRDRMCPSVGPGAKPMPMPRALIPMAALSVAVSALHCKAAMSTMSRFRAVAAASNAATMLFRSL